MTATTDILQPTPPRGSMKKYSETQPEIEKCHSEHSEEPTGYPRMASEPSETPADPSAKASEPSEIAPEPSGTASEHSAALAAPSAGVSERSEGSAALQNSPSKLEGVPRRGEGVCENTYKARTHNLSATKSLRRELRTHGTAAEATMWKMLKARQVMGKQFRRQFAVGAYVLDFYCPEARLAVELDGQPHYTIEGDLHDTDRDELLLAMHGIRTLRFENCDVFRNPEGVLEAIKEALTHSSAADSDTLPRPLATPPNLGGELNTPHAVVTNSSPKLGEVPVGGRSVSNRRGEGVCENINLTHSANGFTHSSAFGTSSNLEEESETNK